MVNTTEPGNIGAAARAMKNMMLSQLYLSITIKLSLLRLQPQEQAEQTMCLRMLQVCLYS